MATTIFEDEIITPTELRSKQKHWLDRASDTPVTIKMRNHSLTLLNREDAKDMCLLRYYTKMFIQFCYERNSKQLGKSDIFPWIKHLDKQEIEEFYEELLSNFKDTVYSKNWLALEEMLNAWRATAEAKTNPEIMELMNPKGRPREYVRLKG